MAAQQDLEHQADDPGDAAEGPAQEDRRKGPSDRRRAEEDRRNAERVAQDIAPRRNPDVTDRRGRS